VGNGGHGCNVSGPTNRCLCNAMGYRPASECSAKASRGLELCPGPPVNGCRHNASRALTALKRQGGRRVATSLLLYCGHRINATGGLSAPPGVRTAASPLLSAGCVTMVGGLAEIGIGAEAVIGAELLAVRAMFASPQPSIISISALVRTQKLAGISWDIEPANSTTEDAQKFAAYLSSLRAALAPLGARVTLYSNAFSPIIEDVALLSTSVDRVLAGQTYNGGLNSQAGAGMAGWLAHYEKLLSPGVNRLHVAPAMLASSLRGTWNCLNASIEQRYNRIVKDGLKEIAIFTFDPTSWLTADGAKSYIDCSNNWLPFLRQFLATDAPHLKSDDAPPASSSSAWRNTTSTAGVSLFSQWGRDSDGDGPTTGSWGQRGYSNCLFVWGVNPAQLGAWRANQPEAVLSHYVPFARDASLRNLSWWKANHPSFILYQCDKKTPAFEFKDVNMPLDISNPDVVRWQLSGADNEYSAEKIAAAGYDAIAFDNYWTIRHMGAIGPCGVWKGGQWVQLFKTSSDPKIDEVQVTWIKNMFKGLQTIKTSRGRRLLLVPNYGVGGSTDPRTDAQVLAIGNHSDGALSECGFTGCGSHLSSDGVWVNKVRFMLNMQAGGKAYMETVYWDVHPQPSTSTYKVVANASTVEFVVSSFLMGKQQAAAIWAIHQFNLSQFTAPVGHPLGDMRLVGKTKDGYGQYAERKFANAFVIVNHRSSGAAVTVPLTAGLCYWSTSGTQVKGSSVLLAAKTARILLLKDPAMGLNKIDDTKGSCAEDRIRMRSLMGAEAFDISDMAVVARLNEHAPPTKLDDGAGAVAPARSKSIDFYLNFPGRAVDFILANNTMRWANSTVDISAVTRTIYQCCNGFVLLPNGSMQDTAGILAHPYLRRGVANSSYANWGQAPYVEAGKEVWVTIGPSLNPGVTYTGVCRAALARKAAFAEELLEIAEGQGLTGYMLDWEGYHGNDIACFNELWGGVARAFRAAGGGVHMGTSIENSAPFIRGQLPFTVNTSYLAEYEGYVAWASVLVNMGSYPGPWSPYTYPAAARLNATPCPGHPRAQCGLEGTILDMLGRGADAPSGQLAPALWPLPCAPAVCAGGPACQAVANLSAAARCNAASAPDAPCTYVADGSRGVTANGWTRRSLEGFLAFADTKGVRSMTLWFSNALQLFEDSYTCPWFMPTLNDWARRPVSNASGLGSERLKTDDESTAYFPQPSTIPDLGAMAPPPLPPVGPALKRVVAPPALPLKTTDDDVKTDEALAPRSYWRFEALGTTMDWEDTQNMTALLGRENGDPNNDAQPWFSNDLGGVVGGFIGLSDADIASGVSNESMPGWFRAEGGCLPFETEIDPKTNRTVRCGGGANPKEIDGVTIEMLVKLGNARGAPAFSSDPYGVGCAGCVLSLCFRDAAITFGVQTSQPAQGTSMGLPVDEMQIRLEGIGVMSVDYMYDSSWHHLAFRKNAKTGEQSIWIDGQSPAPLRLAGNATGRVIKGGGTTMFSLPGLRNFTRGPFPRNFITDPETTPATVGLDELAIWEAALSDAMIYQHYQDALVHHRPYTMGSDSGLPPAPAPAVWNASCDLKEFAPGTLLPTPRGNATQGDPDGGGAISWNNDWPEESVVVNQLDSYPRTRLLKAAKMRPNVNWMDPHYLGGAGQIATAHNRRWGANNMVVNSVLVQAELAQNYNYGLVLWFPAGVDTPLSNATMALANAQPDWPLHVVIPGRGGGKQIHNQSLPSGCYLQDAAGNFITMAGKPAGAKKILRVTTPSLAESAGCPDALFDADGEHSLAMFKLADETLTRPIDLINEDGEIFESLGNLYGNGKTLVCKDAQVQAAFEKDDSPNWDTFESKWRLRLTARFRDIFLQSGLASLKGTAYSQYQVQGTDKDVENYYGNWTYTREINTPLRKHSGSGTSYYSTIDLYPGNCWDSYCSWFAGAGAWHSLTMLDSDRPAAQSLGDDLFSPFVAAGWSVEAERNIRPAQWLGMLKLVGIWGAEFCE
jgi:hypothetical protein